MGSDASDAVFRRTDRQPLSRHVKQYFNITCSSSLCAPEFNHVSNFISLINKNKHTKNLLIRKKQRQRLSLITVSDSLGPLHYHWCPVKTALCQNGPNPIQSNVNNGRRSSSMPVSPTISYTNLEHLRFQSIIRHKNYIQHLN